MRQLNAIRPIGLKTFCDEIEKVCSEAYLYNQGRLRPPHLIMPLDPGSGRTTCIEYMTDMYKNHGIIPFSGLDDYIEVVLDGSPQQIKKTFDFIDRSADYKNEYTNIIGMDISNIANHLNETHLTEFISNVTRICENACVVFFIHSIPSKNEEKLIEKMYEQFCSIGAEKIKRINVDPYTYENIRDLIIKMIDDRGILINHDKMIGDLLLDVIKDYGTITVRDAASVVDALVHFADYSGFNPVINEKSIQSLTGSWTGNKERSEVK